MNIFDIYLSFSTYNIQQSHKLGRHAENCVFVRQMMVELTSARYDLVFYFSLQHVTSCPSANEDSGWSDLDRKPQSVPGFPCSPLYWSSSGGGGSLSIFVTSTFQSYHPPPPPRSSYTRFVISTFTPLFFREISFVSPPRPLTSQSPLLS